MIILVVGDVVGRPGRRTAREFIPQLVEEFQADLVIVNAENSAGGAGVTAETATELLNSGAHILTTGNHVWGHKDSYGFLDKEERILRPANFPPGVPGRGAGVFVAAGIRVGVINLQGRTFMQPIDCPFRAGDEIVSSLSGEADLLIVDMHAEATSEKIALGRFLDGRVACVYGTHTHVPTADDVILPNGTAYITDVGMTGPVDSVIGVQPQAIIDRFVSGLPTRFEVAKGKGVLNGIVLDVDESNGLARSIARVQRLQ